jgi:predicted nucleic acid-binding protein
MRVLFDTSVLVAALVQAHPRHSHALPWLQRAKAGEFKYLVSSHSFDASGRRVIRSCLYPNPYSLIARLATRSEKRLIEEG